jgi:hypothetical protein
MTIDISDLDIKILFHEIWKNAAVASFFQSNPVSIEPEYTEPKNFRTGFWYHCGRPIKIDFTDLCNVNYYEYDYSNGIGKFVEIVTKLRSI